MVILTWSFQLPQSVDQRLTLRSQLVQMLSDQLVQQGFAMRCQLYQRATQILVIMLATHQP